MEEEVRRTAYMKGLQLKNTGLSPEAIYAKLEKQGIPAELAKQVAKDVSLQRKEDALNQLNPSMPFKTSILFSKLIEAIRHFFEVPKS